MNLSNDKALLKVRDYLPEHKKIVLKLNIFSRKCLFFEEDTFLHDLIDGVDIIAVKEVISGFTLKVDTLLSAEGLNRMNRVLLYVFLRGGEIFITCGHL